MACGENCCCCQNNDTLRQAGLRVARKTVYFLPVNTTCIMVLMRPKSLRSWAQEYSIDVLPSPQARQQETIRRRESKFNLEHSKSSSSLGSSSSSLSNKSTSSKFNKTTKSKIQISQDQHATIRSFETNQKVETRHGVIGKWQPGVVRRVNADNSYDVDLDSGEQVFAIPRSRIRRGQLTNAEKHDRIEKLIDSLKSCGLPFLEDFTEPEVRTFHYFLLNMSKALHSGGKNLVTNLKKQPPPPPGPPTASVLKRDRPPPQGRPKVLGKPPPRQNLVHVTDTSEPSESILAQIETPSDEPKDHKNNSGLNFAHRVAPSQPERKDEKTNYTKQEGNQNGNVRTPLVSSDQIVKVNKPHASNGRLSNDNPCSLMEIECIQLNRTDGPWYEIKIRLLCTPPEGMFWYLTAREGAPLLCLPRVICAHSESNVRILTKSTSDKIFLRAFCEQGPILACIDASCRPASHQFKVIPVSKVHFISAELDAKPLSLCAQALSSSGSTVTHSQILDDCCHQAIQVAHVIILLLTPLCESDMHFLKQVEYCARVYPGKCVVWELGGNSTIVDKGRDINEDTLNSRRFDCELRGEHSPFPSPEFRAELRTKLQEHQFERVSLENFETSTIIPEYERRGALIWDLLHTQADNSLLIVLATPSIQDSQESSAWNLADIINQAEVTRSSRLGNGYVQCSFIVLDKSLPLKGACISHWRQDIDMKTFQEKLLPAQKVLLPLLQALNTAERSAIWNQNKTQRMSQWPGCERLTIEEAIVFAQTCLYDPTKEVEDEVLKRILNGVSMPISNSWSMHGLAKWLKEILQPPLAEIIPH